jgi:putative addiction module CopG family antidote
MATTTMNISLTAELKQAIKRRLRSGHYGDASDVVRAGLRALWREEASASYVEWRKIAATLPQDPITPGIEQRIERAIRRERAAERRGKTRA